MQRTGEVLKGEDRDDPSSFICWIEGWKPEGDHQGNLPGQLGK
jgi:hypothetical protein